MLRPAAKRVNIQMMMTTWRNLEVVEGFATWGGRHKFRPVQDIRKYEL